MNIFNGSTSFKLVFFLFAISTVSFVWFYPYPLASDMPMHIAAAKALSDLLGGNEPANYPYALNFQIAPYALAEILLMGPVSLVGVVVGAKLALSLYCLIFPLSVSFLVGQINHRSRWTRLIGYPLTLNYFFHYGFWPYLLGLCGAIFTIGLSIKYENHRYGFLINALTRLATFLMHPVAAIPIGIYDFSTLFLQDGKSWSVFKPATWQWGAMIKNWSLSLIFIALMLATNEGGYTGKMIWVDLWHQLAQILRPLFVSKYPAELAMPLLLGSLIFFLARREIFRCDHSGLVVAGLLMILCGAMFPRLQFLGSWEQGVRVIFVGWILLLSLWSFIESDKKKYIISWLMLAFATNLGVSHIFWMKHSKSFENALAVLHSDLQGDRVILREERAIPNYPSIPIGAHVDLWAWSLGSAADAYNSAAAWNFGPVKYHGLDSATGDHQEALVIYHPYEIWPRISEPFKQRFMSDDEIYSLYRL